MRSIWIYSILLLGLVSCRQKEAVTADPENYSAYLTAYTSGSIGPEDPITIQFTEDVVAADAVGGPADPGLVNISPSAEGQAVWLNRHTVQYQPSAPLRAGAEHLVTVALDKVYQNLDGEKSRFTFSVIVREPLLSLEVSPVFFEDGSAPDQGSLLVRVKTESAAENEAVEKSVRLEGLPASAKQGWEHRPGQHQLLVSNLIPADAGQELVVRCDGSPLNSPYAEEVTVVVPAKGDHSFMDYRLVEGNSRALDLYFGGVLDPSASLEGLIRMGNQAGGLQTDVSGSRVRIFSDGDLVGNQTIVLDGGIRFLDGASLGEQVNVSVEFPPAEPAVRLVGSGVILPDGKGLVFPFEAANLSKVDVEIVKIFSGNVLFFLQNNSLSEQGYEMERVGRIIYQGVFDLDAQSGGPAENGWTRYGVDLSRLIQQEPNAIYNVRIGFRPSYARIACEGEIPEETAATPPSGKKIPFSQSIMNWHYFADYDWERQGDPCAREYYSPDRFVQRNVLASNVGILAKSDASRRSLFIAVSDLLTARPLSGSILEVYDYQMQKIGTATSSSEGVAIMRFREEDTPYFIVARNGSQNGYMKLDDGGALDMSRFDITGEPVQAGLKGMIYAERGVWRPGDSIHANFILYDRLDLQPDPTPIQVSFFDPRRKLEKQYSVLRNTGGIYSIPLLTGPDAVTGNWTLEVRAGGSLFSKVMKIETIKPNRIRIDLKAGSGGEVSCAGGSFPFQLQATWLHGAPASGLKARVELNLFRQKTEFKTYRNYGFDHPMRTVDAEPILLFDGILDEQGRMSRSATLDLKASASGKVKAGIQTRVFEKGGDFSTDYVSFTLSPFNSYVGVRIPENKWGDKFMEPGQDNPAYFVVLDEKGNPKPNARVEVKFYEVDWNWWWDRNSREVQTVRSASNMNQVASVTVTTNGKGEASCTFNPGEDYKPYCVLAEDLESGHVSGDIFYAGYRSEGLSSNEMAILTFAADKQEYRSGETVKLTFPSSVNCRALLTLENGSDVMESRWIDCKEEVTTYTFKADARMVPTLYAHLTVIQPHQGRDNDRPLRMYGVIPLTVKDPETQLQPTVRIAGELKPNENFTVEVSEGKGRACAYTLALVDEGLLDINNFPTPDPHRHFFQKEALGVETWDLFDDVLGAYSGQFSKVFTVGGDAALLGKNKARQANRFKPVVLYTLPQKLDAGKTNKHSFRMPNYVGSVRVMVVAAGDGAFGMAEKAVPVRTPLMVLATLPRVMGPGESVTLPVNVFVMDGKIRDVRVRASESKGLVSFEGGPEKSLKFNQTGDQLADFRVVAGKRTGVAKFLVEASANGQSSRQEVEIDVRNPNPFVTQTEEYDVAAGQSTQVRIQPFGTPGSNQYLAEFSAIPPLNLEGRMRELLHYPYGCVEQTTSSVFPQLYLEVFQELSADRQKKIRAQVTAGINRLQGMQVASGGFAYWPGGETADPWGSVYAGHFLVEARNKGYAVPDFVLKRWTSNQQKAARSWSPKYNEVVPNDWEQLLQAYRLYVLALAKSPEQGAMNRMKEMKSLRPQSRWQLAAAYAVLGKTQVVKSLLNGLNADIPDYREFAYTYGSGFRDKSMILIAALRAGEQNLSRDLSREIAAELNRGGWLSTQETAFGLMAMAAYAEKNQFSKELRFSVSINGGAPQEVRSRKPIFSLALSEAQQNLQVRNSGAGTLFVKINRTGQSEPGAETAASGNLQLSVSYLNEQGKVIPVSELVQGTDFRVKVSVRNVDKLGRYLEQLALVQILPSGWEILNARSLPENSPRDFVDQRDDRVFSFFGLSPGEEKSFYIRCNATYPGRFYLPGFSVSAMYDDRYFARTKGQWVSVKRKI